jgi:hypothetical protein
MKKSEIILSVGNGTQPKILYLCIPYSFSPTDSFRIANEVSAKLIHLGYVVLSPISQSHSIADYLPEEMRKDSKFWLTQDLPLLEKSDLIGIVNIIGFGEYDGKALILNSVGCQAEIKHAFHHHIPKRAIHFNFNTKNIVIDTGVKEFLKE